MKVVRKILLILGILVLSLVLLLVVYSLMLRIGFRSDSFCLKADIGFEGMKGCPIGCRLESLKIVDTISYTGKVLSSMPGGFRCRGW
jgi:hypothetical protein